MSNFQFDVTNWTLRQTISFLVIFFLIYGLGAWHFSEFRELYLDPMKLLNEDRQWLQESPIQYLIGYTLFERFDAGPAYVLTQLVGVLFLLVSYFLLLKNGNIKHSQIFLVLALSPFLFTIFVWFGKADIFLIASCFGMLATVKKNRYLFSLFLLISTFSHVQITIFYLLFFLILKQARVDRFFLLGIIISSALYSIYIYKLNADFGRVDYMYDALLILLKHHVRAPLFDLFSTFGWLWLPIIYFRKSLSVRFYIVAILCFFITVLTLDHTRVFMLLSLPVLVYLSEKVDIVEYANKVSQIFPIWILLFFQFQKWNGAIYDTAWSSFWLPKLARFLGLQ